LSIGLGAYAATSSRTDPAATPKETKLASTNVVIDQGRIQGPGSRGRIQSAQPAATSTPAATPPQAPFTANACRLASLPHPDSQYARAQFSAFAFAFPAISIPCSGVARATSLPSYLTRTATPFGTLPPSPARSVFHPENHPSTARSCRPG